MSESKSLEERVRALAEPIAAELGLDLLELQLSPGDPGTLRLVVERRDIVGPGSGVSIGEITKISKSLGYQLEEDDVVPFAYRFEVSSPGVERNLKTDRDFERYLDQRVKAVGMKPLIKGQYAVEGVLRAYTDQELEIELKDGKRLRVERAALRRVRNVYDFSAAFSRK